MVAHTHAAAAPRSRAICIVVDDFGLHDGVNAAALRLVEMGRAHAVGCLVGGSAWRAASASLARLDDTRLDVGLHLDLSEWPLLPRARRSFAGLVAASLAGSLDRRWVRAELDAQLSSFEQAIGRAPAFIDGHRHVHQLPIVRTELLDALGARYGLARPWLRSTRRVRLARQAGGGRTAATSKAWLIEALGARDLAALADELGYAQNAHLLGVYDFRGGAAGYAIRLAAWLQAAGDADLLMCHPSLAGDGSDGLIDARCAEFGVLGGAALETLMRRANLRLEPMSRILARRQMLGVCTATGAV